MASEKNYVISLRHSQVRELQLALMYHIDTVMIPYLEKCERERDYVPTQGLKKRIQVLKRILTDLNYQAGPYRDEVVYSSALPVKALAPERPKVVTPLPDTPSGGGYGDMLKAVYDHNDDGTVNSADTLKGLSASVNELNSVRGISG